MWCCPDGTSTVGIDRDILRHQSHGADEGRFARSRAEHDLVPVGCGRSVRQGPHAANGTRRTRQPASGSDLPLTISSAVRSSFFEPHSRSKHVVFRGSQLDGEAERTVVEKVVAVLPAYCSMGSDTRIERRRRQARWRVLCAQLCGLDEQDQRQPAQCGAKERCLNIENLRCADHDDCRIRRGSGGEQRLQYWVTAHRANCRGQLGIPDCTQSNPTRDRRGERCREPVGRAGE